MNDLRERVGRGSANPSKVDLLSDVLCAPSAAVVQLRRTSRENCIINVTIKKENQIRERLDIQHHNSHARELLAFLRSCSFSAFSVCSDAS